MMQSEEARKRLFCSETACDIQQALTDFSRWYKAMCIWSHGASFDVPMLEEAYLKCGLRVPWHYKSVRDTRTLFWIREPEWPNNPNKHDALEDARAQAVAVCSSLRRMKEC
jgi:hypothetical protein